MKSPWKSSSPWIRPLSCLAGLTVLLGGPASVRSQLIQTVDYSDTFTVAEHGGVAARTDGSFGHGSPAYDLEDPHGNPTTTWIPFNHFSFNTGLGSTCCGYPTNDGNDGAATGVAQSGGEDFSFAYGLRTDYTFQCDAILPPDRLDIGSFAAPGNSIFTGQSLNVFFRREPQNIGLFNGSAERPIIVNGAPLRTGVTDTLWHNYAVNFNQDAGTISLFVDSVLLATVDLNAFEGGAYRDYSNAAIGAGGTFVFWLDNFQVGEPAPPPTSACFSASATSGLAPLSVDFDATCSFFASPAVSREWTFGDGGTASGVAVSHTFPAGGEYQVTLTVKDQDGATASASKTITVFERASSFADDFDRPDGPIDGWTVFSVPGTWNIASGELHTGPTGEERWIWAGRPAFLFPNRLVLELDMRFLGPGTNAAVGRHAGAVFCANKPTHRYDPTFTGYFIDWIDRSSDHGLRFTRVDAGQLVEIVRGAPGSPAEPPLVWRVEITGQNIRVFGDGTLYIDLVDGTYRGGHVGLWTWAGGQDVAFDNVSVSEPSNPLTACFTYSAAGYAVAGADIAFNATCSENVGAGTVSHSWDFGDGSPAGSSPEVAHAYAAPGRYTVKLTLTDTLGNTAATSQEVVVYQRALAFSDDFERADGPVTGWTVFSVPGTWTISSGELLTGPTNEERWVWAGDTPVLFPKDVVIEWDQTFRGPGTIPVVGRHAGMVFCGSRATHRGDPAFSGYFVDWIDRTDDRGLRFTRVDGGRFVEIIRGQASIPVPDEPPVVWRVELDGDHIKLFGDETLYIDLVDGTYRGGFAGLWTWAGGQEVSYDNFAVTGSPITACFTTSPSVLTTGATVSFDASCSEVFGGAVSSYEWDFGDGGTTAGATASHAYAAAGDVTVKLTVRDGAGGSDVLERRLTVHEALLPFADCFDRAAGPAGGWTAASGTWNITAEGDVETVTGGEAFLYAGDPPRPLVGDFVAEVDWQLLGGTHPVVGRHAALHFFWNLPTTNRFGGDSRGYSVFYIDRAGDRGLTLARWDFGPLTVLNPPGGTPAFSEPPAKLRIEVTGPRIRVFADGEVAIDVEDATYRDGLFALWSWNENTVRFDDVLVGQTELPTCDVVPPEPRFVRGDADATGVINLTDALRVLLYLFSGGAEPPCFDAADADDNGQLQLTDAIRILGWLFLGNPAPLPPSPSVAEFPPADCGVDPSADELGCAAFPPCP